MSYSNPRNTLRKATQIARVCHGGTINYGHGYAHESGMFWSGRLSLASVARMVASEFGHGSKADRRKRIEAVRDLRPLIAGSARDLENLGLVA